MQQVIMRSTSISIEAQTLEKRWQGFEIISDCIFRKSEFTCLQFLFLKATARFKCALAQLNTNYIRLREEAVRLSPRGVMNFLNLQ